MPNGIDFDWFVSRHENHDKYQINAREWTRDIWNAWFDQVCYFNNF